MNSVIVPDSPHFRAECVIIISVASNRYMCSCARTMNAGTAVTCVCARVCDSDDRPRRTQYAEMPYTANLYANTATTMHTTR